MQKKKLQNSVTKSCFVQKVKVQKQQSKKENIKILARAGNRTRDLSHPSQMRYL